MSYIVRVITTKPEGTKWFSEVDPVGFNAYLEWVETIPVVESYRRVNIDQNTIVRQYTFPDEEAFNVYKLAHETHPLAMARRQFNIDNGVTTTFEYIQEG